MSPEEILHIAYEELVEVEPTTAIPELCLLEKTYPALHPLDIARLPLYVALLLKKANMCKIRLPEYLRPESLKATMELEAEKPDEYSCIHPHFFSLANELLSSCYNVEDVEESRTMVERIKEARLAKTLRGIRCLDGKALNMNNITLFEFGEVKEMVLGAMEVGRRIEDEARGK